MLALLSEGLESAFSTSGEVRKRGEGILRELETQPGYLSSLLQVALSNNASTLSSGVQDLSGITFKHGCAKLWRQVTEEEKAFVKSQLLEHLDEIGSDRVAVQVSLGIARIARNDFPGHWQELFPSLVHKLGEISSGRGGGASPAAAVQLHDTKAKRRLYVLHCVIKELASKRLPAARKTFQELSQQLLPIIWQLLYSASEQVAQSQVAGGHSSSDSNGRLDSSRVAVLCQVWQLCIKCMKRLLVSGFPPDAQTYQVHAHFKDILPQLLGILKVIHQQYVAAVGGPSASEQSLVLRGMLKILKLFKDLVAFHPWSFSMREVIAPILEYLYVNITSTLDQQNGNGNQAQQVAGNSLFVEDICTLSMSVLQCITRSSSYRSCLSKGEADTVKRQLVEGAQQLLRDFFLKERLDAMICAIISHHMTLKQGDLEKWQVSPEEFHHENDLGNFHETLRSESEKLLCSFLENFKEETVSTMMKLINQIQSMPQAGIQFSQLLLKESLYNAMCLAAYDLHDFVSFQSFFENYLVKDFVLQSEESKIIIRRAAYLLAAWIADVPDGLRPQVYHLLVQQLLPCEDMVVKLAGCTVLRVFIDDWNFYEDQFEPFLHQALHHLLLIIQHAYDFDSQVQSFNVLCLILERMGTRVKPFANDIIALIPDVWQKAEDQSLLKIQVLNAMQRLMQCLGASSMSTYAIVVPLLHYSVDPDSPESASILEDAFLLLRSTLQFASELDPQIAELVHFIAKHMGRSTEYLPLAAEILEAYVLLGGLAFLQRYHGIIFSTLAEAIHSINGRGLLFILPTIDLILQILPPSDYGILETVLGRLSRRLLEETSDEALIHIGCVFARLSIGSSKSMSQVAGSEVLLSVWMEKYCLLSSKKKRKIVCLGVLAALETEAWPALVRRRNELKCFLLDVGHEFKVHNPLDDKDDDDESCFDREPPFGTGEDPEASRRSYLWSHDPVNKVNLPQLIGKLQLNT